VVATVVLEVVVTVDSVVARLTALEDLEGSEEVVVARTAEVDLEEEVAVSEVVLLTDLEVVTLKEAHTVVVAVAAVVSEVSEVVISKVLRLAAAVVAVLTEVLSLLPLPAEAQAVASEEILVALEVVRQRASTAQRPNRAQPFRLEVVSNSSHPVELVDAVDQARTHQLNQLLVLTHSQVRIPTPNVIHRNPTPLGLEISTIRTHQPF